ncbi:MAG: transposase [Thaumarchaeota archaeon]|nr:transposase [Nitrososphaerota archaeon]
MQRQIQYKAVWEGIPVRFVDPRRTSKLCPICGESKRTGRTGGNYGAGIAGEQWTAVSSRP